ncbi:hypothetical protein C0Q70_04455 [Pomacea canaliculata]|uniref:Endonuclease/exonuclease/phosphatase domain-containing protein n=1 Tax=Pomacea canaliculata TaxID=400727 RepID=A0A2T7PIG5_POMCA|nr:hypothetical protein C0Q70_04455 [Pomacea canaliculata]
MAVPLGVASTSSKSMRDIAVATCELEGRSFGDETKHERGVAFIVRKEVAGTVISCTPVSSRLISIRISARPHNLTIIQVYAPTSEHEDEEVEEFYEELDIIIKKTPKKDILLVLGDWNATIGPDAYQQWAGTVGKFGLGNTNARGLRLLEFAQSHRLTIANTLHPHKKSRTVTWHSPGGLVHNQIDFILLPQRFKSSINKAQTRSFPGADIGSDHNLVLTSLKLKLKLRRDNKSPRIRFNLEKLKDPDTERIFQAQTKCWGSRGSAKQPWVTDDILDLCDERRALKKGRGRDPTSADKYRLVNQQIRTRMKEAKEDWIEDQCCSVEIGMASGDSKKAYETQKALTKTQQRPATVIEDSTGQLLTEKAAVLSRWTEYCQDLYNYKIEPDTSILQHHQTGTREAEDLPVLTDEVRKTMHSLKGGKSPGVPGGAATTKAFTTLCQKIWEEKKWPEEWAQSIIIPLPKSQYRNRVDAEAELRIAVENITKQNSLKSSNDMCENQQENFDATHDGCDDSDNKRGGYDTCHISASTEALDEIHEKPADGLRSETETGFNNWKKALEKFNCHHMSSAHRAVVGNKMARESGISVYGQISTQYESQQKQNLASFMNELKSLVFLLRQALPIRGHDDDEGNLHQCLKICFNNGTFYPALCAGRHQTSKLVCTLSRRNERYLKQRAISNLHKMGNGTVRSSGGTSGSLAA